MSVRRLRTAVAAVVLAAGSAWGVVDAPGASAQAAPTADVAAVTGGIAYFNALTPVPTADPSIWNFQGQAVVYPGPRIATLVCGWASPGGLNSIEAETGGVGGGCNDGVTNWNCNGQYARVGTELEVAGGCSWVDANDNVHNVSMAATLRMVVDPVTLRNAPMEGFVYIGTP